MHPLDAQDGPPPGGFPPVKYKRSLSKGGPSSLVMAVGAVGIFVYGMYKVGQANRTRRCDTYGDLIA